MIKINTQNCINRQDAIDALRVAYWDDNIQSAKDDPCIVDAMTDWAIRQVKALPPAQHESLVNESRPLVKDTISRQAAINKILGQPPEPHYPSWYAEQIKELPPAQPEILACGEGELNVQSDPRWIPVTERLPETNDEVLTTYIVNGDRNKKYVETASYYQSSESWYSVWDEFRVAGTRIEVIAWMPLPEPYKEVIE